MRTRSLRGKLDDTTVKQLVVDDGRLTNGYKVKEFHVWVDGGGEAGVYAVLGKEYDMVSGGDASDARQIAWAGNAWSTGINNGATMWSIIDPDHVVLQDLYIQRINPADACNYLIVLEQMTLTNDESILQLIKERSQDDTR
tara:strand:- start:132 stop:554 length:423 start_codon:yes stop_codon:yes gene_type:complete